MPSPELQSAIDSFDYRSYLKLNGYTDEQIPESLDEETKQKLFSLAYTEHFDNLVKERQATTPGSMTEKEASDEVEAEELEAKPYLRPLFGLWERELGAEELYKAEMLFPLLKEEGIDVSTPYFDPEALGEEQSKKKLEPILDRYVEQVINKKTPKNAPELKGVGKSQFKQQFLQRNGLFAEDDIGSFLKVYKKNADTEAIQQDVDERGTLGWLGDLLSVAANQGMDMLVSSIPFFVQHRLQGTRIPDTDILLSDPLQQTVGEGTSWFTNKLLDLGDWSRRKSAKLAEEREKMQFKPRYGGTLEDYWDRGEWTNIGGALMEQLVLNGSSVVQNILTPLFINFGSRVVTPITTGVGGLFGPGGAAAGLAVGRAATLGIAGGMMGTGALMTASDAIADLHELGIYDDAQVNKYLEHIYTAVALDSMSTLMEAAIIGGGKFVGPIGKNRQAIRAQQQANDAAARANGLDTNVINHLAGRQLLRNRGLTNEANRRIWQRMATGDGAWRVMRRTAGGMLVEGGQERQQEAINMDLVNMMTSTNQEGMIEAGFTGWINPFFTDLPQREGGYRFPDKMVRHRLAIAGLTGAIMGGATTAVGTGIQEFANARRKAAEDKDSLTVTDKDGRTLIMRNLAAQRAAAAGAFRDMAAAGQGVNAQTIIGVGLSQSEGNSFASFNGVTGVGKDANSAFIDLTMRANSGRRNIDLSTLTAVADGHEVTLANGEKLTVKGTNSEQTLRDLVNLHNSDNHPLVITSGATIEYNAGQAKPYTITQSNGTVVRTESLYDNYALYNFASHADSNLVFDSILRRSGTQDTEGFINLNITQTGDFNFKVSEQAIRDSIDNSNGRFVLLDATVSRKGAKQRIRANGSLQSDTMKVADLEQGIIYDIKLKRGRNNSNAHVNVTARDLGGKVLRLDADVAKQTIRDAANPNALKNQIRLKAPAKNGITIQGEQVAGQTLWHFNRNQIDEITRLTGAVLANYQDNLAEFVLPGYRRNADGTMEEFGTMFSISLDENGKVFAHANGQDIAIEGINEYDSLVPGETNLYAHALQGGRFSTVSVDQNTGAITLRRTTPGGADIELVLGRRGTIDSYRVVSDNSARAQGMVDQAIAARNAQTAAQQQSQQQMGQIVDTELQQFTTAELIQMGFDPVTIHDNIRAAFSGELLAELQLTATDFQSARDILTNRFGYPADRFLVHRLMNEAGVTNQWVLTDKNDNIIATFDNTTQGFRDFKQMLDPDTVNNLLAVNDIEPYLLEQLAKNPTRPIMSFTDAEYQAAVQKFFEYHDGVFRPRPDTDNIVRSTERRKALLRSYRIHFDEVYNHRMVLTDIAGIRALYGEALEEGYGLWDRVNKTFQKDANGNTYFGDRAYINSLRRNAQGAWISAYASMNAQPLYKIANNYYSENEIVQAANKTSNLDLITEDVIENIIDRREQGYRELPSERVLRGERRYIDILNDIIHEEARRLLDPKYNDINEIAAYYGSNFVRKKTWRRMMNGEYVYLGTDGNFYSVIDVANDANIRMRVLWDDNQFPHPSQSMLAAHNYSEVYTVTNDNGVEIYYQEIRLRDQTGRKRPKADYDRSLNNMVQRLRMVNMLMLKHDTYDVNDQINDKILDEDQETPIPPPNRADIEADVQRELEQRAANAQTIEEFFDIYGAQVQQRYVVHDSATGLNVGRNGNTVDVGVDSFLTEAEVADYVRQHGFAATQEVTPYYVFFTGDGTAIESFAPVDYESSFMDELRLPEKVAFIDISARVDAEFQAEEARVGAQKQRREALRKQRAAAAAQAANASQNTTTQNPNATASNLSYADYLTRLFGTDSFVSLGAKVELWQGKTSMSRIMSMSIDIAYENMLAGAGERDINDPAQSLERELNSTVGRLWRSAKARGLVRIHKTMADYWAANPTTLNKVLEDYQKKKLARETRRAQNAIPLAEIQAAVAAMSQDEIDTVTKSMGVVGQYDYDNKVIHLVEENIPLERAANVFYHELAVHATMHLTGTNLAGQWMDIMRYLKAHENDKSELGRAIRRIKANRIGVKLQKENSNIYWEEIAAYLVEDYINRISFVERIRAFFRDVFRRTGIVKPNEEVTIADIVRFAKAKAKITVSMSDKLDTAHQGYSHANAPFFSLMGSAYHVDAQTAQDQFESIDQYYNQVQYSDRYGMVHDRQTGILNESNLSRGHWVLARTPMFKKWFGDWENRPYNASKIVDTSGEPLLVYHNPKYDHDAYDEPFIGLNGNFGHSGKFIYQDLAENPYAEKLLGGEVAQSFINIRKPLHVHNYEEMEKYMESLGYERSSKRLDLDKLATSVRSNPSMRVVIEGIADYASDTEPTTSFADFMILNENAVFSAVPLTTMREAHQFLGGLFEAATTPRDSILVNEPVMNAETLDEWYETLETEEERQEWRSAMEIFERNLTPFENHMLRLSYNPDGYFTHLSRGHEDLTLSTREVIRDVMGAIDARYHAYGERDIIEFREAVQRTYDEVGNDELFLDMFNMALHQARREELIFRLGEDLDVVTTPAYPVPSAQALLKEDNRELARSLKTAMMRDGYDGLLGSDDILMFHPDQAHDALGFLRPFPERNIRPTQGIRTDPREQRVMEAIDGNITRDAKALGVTPVRLRSEFREIYHALGDTYFSILDPYSHILVRTPSFKENFGDWQNDPNSEMVLDERGEPLRLSDGFHSGTRIIDVGYPSEFRTSDSVANYSELARAVREIEREDFEDFQDTDGALYFSRRSRYGETEDVVYGPGVRPGMSETYYGLPTASVIPQEMRDAGVRYVESAEEAERVHQQYREAMERQSDHRGPLYQKLLARRVVLYEDNGSYVASPRKAIEATGNIFVISHFAPKSLRDGVRMVKNLATSPMKVMAAVPPYQGNMLRKAGFEFTGQTVQPFQGELVLKDVYTNQAVTQEEKDELFKHYTAGRSQAEMDALLARAKRISGKRDDGATYFSMTGSAGPRMPAVNASPDPITEYIPYERAQEFYGTGEGSMVWGPGTYVQLPIPEEVNREGVGATSVTSAATYRKWWKGTSSFKFRDEAQQEEYERLSEEAERLYAERTLIKEEYSTAVDQINSTIFDRVIKSFYGTPIPYDNDARYGFNEIYDYEGNHYVLPDSLMSRLFYRGKRIGIAITGNRFNSLVKNFGIDEVREALLRNNPGTYTWFNSGDFFDIGMFDEENLKHSTEARSIVDKEYTIRMDNYEPVFDEDGRLTDIVPRTEKKRVGHGWRIKTDRFLPYIKNGKLQIIPTTYDNSFLNEINKDMSYLFGSPLFSDIDGTYFTLHEMDKSYSLRKYVNIKEYNNIIDEILNSLRDIKYRYSDLDSLYADSRDELDNLTDTLEREYYGSMNLISVPNYDEMIFDPYPLGAQSLYVQERLLWLIEDYRKLGAIPDELYVELMQSLFDSTRLDNPFAEFNSSSWSTRQLLLKLGAAIAKYNGDNSSYADSNTYTKVLLDYGIKALRYVGSHDKHAAVIFDGRDIDVVDNVLPANEDLSLEEVRRVFAHVRPTQDLNFSEDVNDFYFSMLGPQGAERLLGTDDYRQTAEAMRQAGKDARTIKLATGYEWSDDQQAWEYEVSNIKHGIKRKVWKDLLATFREGIRERIASGDELHPNVGRFLEELNNHELGKPSDKYVDRLVLSDVFNAPEIYEAYPSAANIDVQISFHLPDGTEAEYDALSETIRLNPFSLFDLLKLRSSILHEVQHHIQNEENFPYIGANGNETDINEYWNNPGEVEARRVENRRYMTQDEMRGSLFSETYADQVRRNFRTIINPQGIDENDVLYFSRLTNFDFLTQGVLKTYEKDISIGASKRDEKGKSIFDLVDKITNIRDAIEIINTSATGIIAEDEEYDSIEDERLREFVKKFKEKYPSKDQVFSIKNAKDFKRIFKEIEKLLVEYEDLVHSDLDFYLVDNVLSEDDLRELESYREADDFADGFFGDEIGTTHKNREEKLLAKNNPLINRIIEGIKNLRSVYVARTLSQLMNDSTPEETMILLGPLANNWRRALRDRGIEASRNNIRNTIALLMVQDPGKMRAIWNHVINGERGHRDWLPYKERIEDYTEKEINDLIPAINNYLTERRGTIVDKWNRVFQENFGVGSGEVFTIPTEKNQLAYLMWRSLYTNFAKRNPSSMPVEAKEKYLKAAFDEFAQTWRQDSNFYNIYTRIIMEDLINNAAEKIEIANEKGEITKMWLKIAHDKDGAMDYIEAASMSTNWCTDGRGGERSIIEFDKHDFWVLYDLKLKESILAFVPIREGEEDMLTNHHGSWYTGIFNRENPNDNTVPESLKGDVRTLFNGTNDEDVRRTLTILGTKWMDEEELTDNRDALLADKMNRLVNYFENNSVLNAEILPLVREIIGIDIFENDEGKIVLHENMDNDFRDKLFSFIAPIDWVNNTDPFSTITNSIDEITGNISNNDNEYDSSLELEKLTFVEGNVYAVNTNFPHLQYVSGNFEAYQSSTAPELTRVNGNIDIDESVKISDALKEEIVRRRTPSQPQRIEEGLSDDLDSIFDLPPAPDETNNFFSMRGRGEAFTNYMDDLYDRTEIVGSGGAYKLKNGKIFVDVDEVGQENVLRVMLYALIRESPEVLNNANIADAIAKIRGWESSADVRERAFFSDIKLAMTQANVPDSAILAYAVRKMLEDGIDPSNPANQTGIEGVFAAILNEIPGIIGQASGVSTSRVNVMPSDIITVTNALAGVENVGIDVAVPSLDVSEEVMQTVTAASQQPPLMAAVMREVQELIASYDNAHFDTINGRPHLVLGGQNGLVLDLTLNPLYIRNVVDQFINQTTDFGNFDTTDPNSTDDENKGKPGNPFTHIVEKMGTAARLNNRARQEDVDRFINTNLPAYIADRIQVVYDETPEFKTLFNDNEYGGIYRPVTADRKVIYIRAYDRNLSDVIGSIVHLTSNFGWTMWQNADFVPLMDELWTVLKHNIQNDIPTYYERLGGKPPTSSQKAALISAYLATKSKSIYDLAEFSRSPYVPSSEQQHMLDIAAKVKDQITQVELNIAKSFAQDFMENEELVKEYSEKLLRMTMAPFYGKGMWFAYDVDYDNLKATNPNTSDKYAGWGHVMVFANDFGQVYKPIPLNDDALVNQVMLQNYRKSKPFWRDVKLKIWRNWHPPMKGVGDTILGLENTILLTRVWRAVTTEWGSALENIYTRTSAFDDKLIKRGIDTEDFSRAKGYVQELQDRGITDKKLLEEAEIIDAFLRYGRQKMLQNVSEIRNLISMSAQRAEYWMRHENVPERDIMKMHREMDRYAQRFVADWEHRSYRAFSREDQDNLQEMWNILDGYSSPPTGSDWFSNIARNAQRDLATLEQQKTQGQISESDYAKQRRDLRHTIKMYERLDALYHWTNQNVMARLPNLNSPDYRTEAAAVPQRVNQEMKTEIENIMTQVKNVGQRGLLGKMDLIPAFRKRKLNENIPHDRLYMTFLDQVKNPAMSMLHNLDQQGKILDKLTFNLRFGESILQNGMGTMKGSRDHVNLGVDNLSWMESGSFLQYVKVDPFFLDEIRNEQEIQLNVREHFMGGLINMLKQNFTVLNWRMMLSNYIGNISNMIATGQIFRWGHLKAGLIGVNKRKLTSLLETDMSKSFNRLKGDALKRSVTKGIEDYNSIVAEYTKEMERLNIWGSGTTSTDMTFYGQSGWEKIADYGAAVLEAVGAINDTTHRSVNRLVGEKLKVARELYGYGDEWVKPLTYMNNRAVAMAKYRAQENWAQYEGREDSHEARLLDERIRDMASREAAMLTMKETTTWELSPDAIRKLAAQKVRVVTPDFLLHGFQMARIMTVNVGRTFECAGEVARLMAKGKENLTEDERIYLKLVGGELIRRSIGQTLMTTTMWNMAHYGGSLGIYVLGNAIAALRGAGDEDDEERKRRRGRARSEDSTFAVSPSEHTALSMLCNAVSMVSDLYAPLMWVEGKVGKEFYALNWQRSNAAYTFGTVRPATVNPTFFDRAKHVLLELADLRSDPLSVQVANIIRGKNRYDQDITRKEQLQEGALLLLPQVGHQLNNIRLGLQQLMLGTENMSWAERRRNYPLSVYDAVGIKVRKYSVLDMIENTGREVNKLQQEYGNAYKRNFFRTLERKLDMTDKDIADAVSAIVENNTYQMDRIRYSMEAFRLLGIDRKTLEERLALTRNGSHKIMGQNEIGLLLAGRDVLTANVLTNLASKIKQLQDFQSDTNIPTGERRKVLDNYQRAYRKLVEAMR